MKYFGIHVSIFGLKGYYQLILVYILLFLVFLKNLVVPHLRAVCYAMEYVVILVKIFGLEANYKLILVYFILFCAPYGHKVDNSFIPVTRDCK